MMRAYLRTVKARVGTNTSDITMAAADVALEVPDGTALEAGAIVHGTIASANSGGQGAYLMATYPTVELLAIDGLDFGARIIEPNAGVPGTFPVGTQVKFQVQ